MVNERREGGTPVKWILYRSVMPGKKIFYCPVFSLCFDSAKNVMIKLR